MSLSCEQAARKTYGMRDEMMRETFVGLYGFRPEEFPSLFGVVDREPGRLGIIVPYVRPTESHRKWRRRTHDEIEHSRVVTGVLLGRLVPVEEP